MNDLCYVKIYLNKKAIEFENYEKISMFYKSSCSKNNIYSESRAEDTSGFYINCSVNDGDNGQNASIC